MLSLFEHILTTPREWLIVWIGLALLILLLFLRRPGTLTLASGEKGRLQISRHALHRLIETCCEQLHGVASARALVVRRKGKFETIIRLRIRPNAKLDAIQGYLTQEVGDIFRENLGISAVGGVEIKVIGVAPIAKGF